MRILLRLIFLLVLGGGIGLVGYAYLGDLSPEQQEMVVPVTVDAG
jgi:membrane protein required for beta-lactamase induction